MKSSKGSAKGGALTPADFGGNGGSADERRTEPRLPCTREIAIMPCTRLEESGFRRVGLFDCSRHGLGFLSDEPMQAGEEFLAKLQTETLTLLVYRICHCTPVEAEGGRYFTVGAELVGTIGPPDAESADAVLRALLGRPN